MLLSVLAMVTGAVVGLPFYVIYSYIVVRSGNHLQGFRFFVEFFRLEGIAALIPTHKGRGFLAATYKRKALMATRCTECGKHPAVFHGDDPYVDEIYGIKREVKLCESCLKSSLGDI